MSVSTAATTIKYPVVLNYEGHAAPRTTTISWPPSAPSTSPLTLGYNDWLVTIVESGEAYEPEGRHWHSTLQPW